MKRTQKLLHYLDILQLKVNKTCENEEGVARARRMARPRKWETTIVAPAGKFYFTFFLHHCLTEQRHWAWLFLSKCVHQMFEISTFLGCLFFRQRLGPVRFKATKVNELQCMAESLGKWFAWSYLSIPQKNMEKQSIGWNKKIKKVRTSMSFVGIALRSSDQRN